MTIREQIITVQRFLNGDINVLVATSVAEEGLDIPDCNMVIRFDQCNTMIQYVQSRGRARQAGSRLYHLVQAGHHGHRALISEIQGQEMEMRRFCATLPEDRRIDASPASVDDLYPKRANEPSLTISSTGARLTYRLSLDILAGFAHSLPLGDLGRVPTPEYIVRSTLGSFIADVRLPDNAPITLMIGKRETSKQLARCSAAFELCKELRRLKCLDEWLRPVFTKHLPAMRNKRLALTSIKVSEYAMQIKPTIWSSVGFPQELFMAVLVLASPSALGRKSAPISFLSRTPIPAIGDIPLFFAGNRTSCIRLINMGRAVHMTEGQVSAITNFTLRIFRDVFSKEYDASSEQLPYFLAPLQGSHSTDFGSSAPDIQTLLDWRQLETVMNADYYDLDELSEIELCSKYVIDPHDGSRKFYTRAIASDVKPSDTQRTDARRTARAARTRRDVHDDIWNYSVSLWSNARGKIPRDENLQVVEAELVTIRQNLLDSTEKIEPNAPCYLVFATLKVSLVSWLSWNASRLL